MYAKIVVTNPKNFDRDLLSRALSHVTAIPLLTYKTAYEWCRRFQIDYLKNTLEWQQMFLISASSFIERIEIEADYPQFISNGAAFGFLMPLMLQSMYRNNSLQAGKDKMCKALMNACFEYAAEEYDFVIHIDSNAPELCKPYIEVYEKYNIPYRIYKNNDLETLLPQIIKDLNLPIKQSVEKTILYIKENIFY